MNDILNIRRPLKKVYASSGAAFACLLGGPLCAAYVISHNYLVFGQRSLAMRTWLIGIIVTAAYTAMWLVPFLKQMSPVWPTVIMANIAGLVIKVDQECRINAHRAAFGKFYSLWRTALIAAIFAAASLAILFAIGMIGGSIQQLWLGARCFTS